MHLKISSAKCRPVGLDIYMLTNLPGKSKSSLGGGAVGSGSRPNEDKGMGN